MEKVADEIRKILEEKLFCYQRLAEVLDREKGCIADINLDELWETTASKKKLAKDIVDIRERLIAIFKESSLDVEMDPRTFSLSYLLKVLPVSPKFKSGLQTLGEEINTTKKRVIQVGRLNREQIQKHLQVVDDVMGVMVDNKPMAQYTGYGRVNPNKKIHCLVNAEV